MCIGNSTKVPEKIAVQMDSVISLELGAIIDLSVEDILAIHKRDPEGTVALVLAQRKVIIEMAMEVEQLKERIRELEGQKSKDSHNSSKSSSTDTRRTSKGRRVKSGKPSGGQKGHPGHTLKMVDKPDKVVVHPVTECSHCGRSLEGIAAVDSELRQVFDLPPMNVEVTEHRAEIKICPFCSSPNKATFPKEAQSPVQYGSWIKTIAVYWNQYQLMPYERLSESFLDLYGHAPSQATLIQATHECYEALEYAEARIKELLHASHAMCVDETGMRIEGERKWCHVYGTNSETFYAPHNKRGAEAGNDIGILPGYKGTVVHDGLISYFKFDCKHALCNSHHIRDLTFVHEEYDQSWPQELVDLLLKIKNAVDIRKTVATELDPWQIMTFEKSFDKIIEMGELENPQPTPVAIPDGLPKKRGRKKQSIARNLLNRLRKYRMEALAFMYDFEVPFDNNLAERDLRMMKVQQKISGTFRSWEGARMFCRIRGYVSTVRKRSLSVIDAIFGAMTGAPFIPGPVSC